MASRYLVVEHSVAHEKLILHKNEVNGKHPVHHLLGAYHWVRLDEDHILVKGTCSISKHIELHNHEKASVLPISASTRPLKRHFTEKIKGKNKMKHMRALTNHFALTSAHTMEDVLEAIEEKHGPLFSINK